MIKRKHSLYLSPALAFFVGCSCVSVMAEEARRDKGEAPQTASSKSGAQNQAGEPGHGEASKTAASEDKAPAVEDKSAASEDKSPAVEAKSGQPAESASGETGEGKTPEPANPSRETEAAKTTLKGGVRGAAILTEDGLASLEGDAKVLQTTVYEIMRECTRKETAVVRGPNYIGNGIVIPAIGGPSGMMQIGDLPARRDKLEAFLGSSEEVLNVLQNHMDALIIPENPPEQMANLWTGMRSTLQSAHGNIDKMKELLAVHKFDKKLVGRAALHIYDSMTALEKMRAQILAMVQAKE